MKSPVLRELYCSHCDEPIGDYDFEEKYITRKLYPTMRNFWPFHVDYSHYSGRPVFVHQACRKDYYNTRFHGEEYEVLASYSCKDCKTPFSEEEFYISRDKKPGGFVHRHCIAAKCDWCHEVIETLPHLKTRDYYFHKVCCFDFCDNRALGNDCLRVDADRLWPDNFNPMTACRYPPEFLITAKTLLLVIHRLGLKHLINRDMICMIMDRAVCPNLYPMQHGLELRRLPWIRGGSCDLCKSHFAFTRFDKDCCSYNCCRIYIDKTCPWGHKIKRGAYKPGDCTIYRCCSEQCKVCTGSFRRQKNLELELCSRETCNFKDDKMICFCGNDLYKEKTPEGLVNVLPDTACIFEQRCDYLIKGEQCKCGDNLYFDYPKSFRCIDGICRKTIRNCLQLRIYVKDLKSDFQKLFYK